MSSPRRPNVVFLMPDQLRARSLPLYQQQLPNADQDYPLPLKTPRIDALAGEGVTLDHVVSTCPVCTPYRGMLQTGRYPQTTGHIINSVRTRWSEIGIADAFAARGYRTSYIGKWHLHTGAWPANNVPDWVPEGRDRLGWQYWRAYNQHMVYFDGFVNGHDWDFIRWKGYETDGLLDFAGEFLDDHQANRPDDPFFLLLSPHPPHFTPYDPAPSDAYDGLPDADDMPLPANVRRDEVQRQSLEAHRHYLAMIRMVDRMVGRVLDDLKRRNLLDETLVVFTSDHGTMGNAHGMKFWEKKMPHEESIHVPWIMRLPFGAHAGERRSVLTTPVDILPSLCTLCDVPIPRTVEGRDLSGAWLGRPSAPTRDAALLMNFSDKHDHFCNGAEWRGVRTLQHTYARFLDGRESLFDLEADPLQRNNLAESLAHRPLLESLIAKLVKLQAARGDSMLPCEDYRSWLDSQRRVIRNAWGPLPHPEQPPDWSLLRPAE